MGEAAGRGQRATVVPLKYCIVSGNHSPMQVHGLMPGINPLTMEDELHAAAFLPIAHPLVAGGWDSRPVVRVFGNWDDGLGLCAMFDAGQFCSGWEKGSVYQSIEHAPPEDDVGRDWGAGLEPAGLREQMALRDSMRNINTLLSNPHSEGPQRLLRWGKDGLVYLDYPDGEMDHRPSEPYGPLTRGVVELYVSAEFGCWVGRGEPGVEFRSFGAGDAP